ncbi:MAG: homoserine O-acetyltransferase [Acidobacteria bacterium]|nr:homoserine O-acetyltransferase [Acidobacteriota bacterium]MBI3426079.1 homoserine O-acetyltransferase [Acidobacteriota bacterium]
MPNTFVPTYEGDLHLTDAQPFTLVSGEQLPSVKLRYALYGSLNDARDNAILVCHALSGSARVGDWWPQLFGEHGIFDLERDCIICVNVIGSCYGSTGPRDVNPATGELYGADFPLVAVRDWVQAQAVVLGHLGIAKLRAVIGGSIGGMQAMQWAIDLPERVERCLAVGAAPLTAMGLALNHLQRQAIVNDPHWLHGRYRDEQPPSAGLAQARAIAMCSYKSEHLFQERYGRRPNRNGEDPQRLLKDRYEIGGYLDYQGEIFTRRFDAASYVVITKAMDNFDPAQGYASELAALQRIKALTLLVGISSDWLFPATEVRALSERMLAAGVTVEYAELQSEHGHDGFLAEADALAPLLRKALEPESHDIYQLSASLLLHGHH